MFTVDQQIPQSVYQKRFWLEWALDPNDPSYNVSAIYKIGKELNKSSLVKSCEVIIKKYILLSAYFSEDGSEQYLGNFGIQDFFDEIHLDDVGEKELLSSLVTSPFYLNRGPLFRFYLVSAEDAYYFIIVGHHVVCDGVALAVLAKDIAYYYGLCLFDQIEQYPYNKCLNAEKELFSVQDFAAAKQYWREIICDFPVMVDFPKEGRLSNFGTFFYFDSTPDEAELLRGFVRQNATTLFCVLSAAYAVALSRYSNQEQLLISYPVNVRPKQFSDVVGCFTNSLPLRIDVATELSFLQLVSSITDQRQGAKKYQWYPYHELIKDLRQVKGIVNEELNVSIAETYLASQCLGLHGVHTEGYDAPFNSSTFQLILEYDASVQEEIKFRITCREHSQEFLQQFANHFRRILVKLLRKPTCSIRCQSILSAEEHAQIIRYWNQTSAYYPDKVIHQLFELQEKCAPDNVAIIFENQSITYRQLNEQSNQLARLIRAQYQARTGCSLKSDTLIALCVNRSLEMIIGLLGILKAGAAYVPLDPEYPDARLLFMLEDSQAKIILTHTSLAEKFLPCKEENKLAVVALDSPDVQEKLNQLNANNLKLKYKNTDLAYVIYTSGSTGVPKGVAIEHRSLVNLLHSMQVVYGLGPNHRHLSVGSIAFDAATRDIFWSLVSGTELVISSSRAIKDPKNFIALFNSLKIHVMSSTPSAWQLLLDSGWEAGSDLLILSGGSALPPGLAKKLLANGARLWNFYGPTETAVTSVRKNITMADEVVLGRPIQNVKIYVLDKYLHPVPVGVVGELYISGVCLARGYLNRPQLTAQRFINNPFFAQDESRDYERLYKTGDLVRLLPGGDLQFIGRNDDQVKVRGYRIELGEIEAVLSNHEAVRQSVIVAQEYQEHQRLIAYYSAQEQISATELRRYLGERLPHYMLPSIFIYLNQLPLTVNGKIDHRALPQPNDYYQSDEYIAPRNVSEQLLVDIWCELLQINRVSINDNFFSVGGDSILSIQIVSRARESGLIISPKQLFEYPTIAELALIAEQSGVVAEQGPVVGAALLTPIQCQFFEQNLAEPNYFNQSFLVRTPEGIDFAAMKNSLHALIVQHDSLRLRYLRGASGDWQQFYDSSAAAFNVPIVAVPLENVAAEQQLSYIDQQCTLIQSRLDIGCGPIMSVGIFTGHVDGDTRLLFAIHHLVVDGVSWRIILEDLEKLYDQFLNNQAIRLSAKTSSYQAWGEALLRYARSEALIAQHAYWQDMEKHIAPLPVDYHAELIEVVGECSFVLDIQLTKSLLQSSNQLYRTQINDLLLSALVLAVYQWHGLSELVLNLEGHGREEIMPNIDLARTVGWFTGVFPVYLHIPTEVLGPVVAWHKLIPHIKAQLRAIPDKGIGYGVCRYLSTAQNECVSIASPQLCFNYLGQFNTSYNNSRWRLSLDDSGQNISPVNRPRHLITINGLVIEGRLRFDFSYSATHYNVKSIDQLVHYYKTALEALVSHCLNPIVQQKSVVAIYPLSPLQQGLLFHALHAPESDQYCEQIHWTYDGLLDKGVLKQAWGELIQAHPILRTRFMWEGVDSPVQMVESMVELPWYEQDWRQFTVEKQVDQLAQYLKYDREQGFDLSKVCALRLHLICLGDSRHEFIFTHHHILLDGWCLPLLQQELANRYAAIVGGKRSIIPSAPPYERYIEWLQQQDRHIAQIFWAEQLRGIEAPTPLSMNRPGSVLDARRPIELQHEKIHILSQEFTTQLQRFGREFKITLNTLFQFAWAKVLSVYSGQDEVIFGATISGRSAMLPHIDRMVGLFINTLPVCVRLNNPQDLLTQLLALQGKIQSINQYGYLSLSEIQNSCSEISAEHSLFYSLFVFENYPVNKNNVHYAKHLELQHVRYYEKTNYPLALMVMPGEQLCFKAVYDEACFESEKIVVLLQHVEQVLKNIVDQPSQGVQSLSILSLEEQQKILMDWNNTDVDYPKNKTITRLFEEQVERTPDSIAVTFASESLSYRELNAKANQLAHYLRELGVESGDLVSICLDKSIELIIAVLGVLKSGGVYVPVEVDFPVRRMQYIIDDGEIKFSISNKGLVLENSSLRQIDLEGEEKFISKRNNNNPVNMSNSGDIACIFYTSGSTGRPKGIMLGHKVIANLVHWHFASRTVIPKKISLFASIGFDMSIHEITYALLNGCELVIIPEMMRKEPAELVRFIVDNEINQLFLPTAMLDVLAQESNNMKPDFSRLTHVIVAGDALKITNSVRDLFKFYSHICLENHYGPSETHVVTYLRLLGKDVEQWPDFPSIGKPIGNTRLYVLDKFLQSVPIGVAGELYVGGECLAHGYLNLPQLTEECFIVNPFDKNKSSRLYKTGDLVCWRPDGCLDFLGRKDHQVKIRGFRVELREVELCLESYQGVRQAIVLLSSENEDKQLIAFLLANNDMPINSSMIRRFLTEKLPGYMIPSEFVVLDHFPLTKNGKIDYKNLKSIVPKEKNTKELACPQGCLEELLVEIWELVLNRSPIGVLDNFFDLGGHSILAIRLVAEIQKKMGKKLPIKTLFNFSTVREMAEVIRESETAPVEDMQVLHALGISCLSYDEYSKLLTVLSGSAIRPFRPGSLMAVLNPDGVKKPIFWCGNDYNEPRLLGKYLGEEQPFYIMYSGAKVLENRTEQTFDALASYYVNEIIHAQPEGPYFIAGYCSGAKVAMEIALQLAARGKEIARLCLLEFFDQRLFEYDGKMLLLYGKESHLHAYKPFGWGRPGWQSSFRAIPEVSWISGIHDSYFVEPNIQELLMRLKNFFCEEMIAVG